LTALQGELSVTELTSGPTDIAVALMNSVRHNEDCKLKRKRDEFTDYIQENLDSPNSLDNETIPLSPRGSVEEEDSSLPSPNNEREESEEEEEGLPEDDDDEYKPSTYGSANRGKRFKTSPSPTTSSDSSKRCNFKNCVLVTLL
jgi:hypothetical protein